MKVEFAKEREGNLKRVRWERDIVNPELLLRVQSYLPYLVSGASLYKGSSLHLTSFFFGRPDGIESDLKKNNPCLTGGQFANNFQEFLTRLNALNVGPIQTRAGDLALYGNEDRYFMVLTLPPTPKLCACRDFVYDNMRQILEDCGVKDSRDYMRNHRAWRTQVPERYNPHITLAKIKPREIDFNFDVPDFLIKLSAPQLRGVTITR